MLRRFLSILVYKEGNKIEKKSTNNHKLFAGGKIKVKKNSIETYKEILISKLVVNHPEILNSQGEHPVIYFNFHECEGGNYKQVKERLQAKIVQTVRSFMYLALKKEIFCGPISIAEEYADILKEANSDLFILSMRRLSSLLSSHYGKNVWILIDEYDAAANIAFFKFSQHESEQDQNLFKDVYKSAFKDNTYLEKGVLTGIQSILKSAVGSGLNNISIENVTSETYTKYYGIDQDEMNLLIEHFNIDQDRAKILKDWYNGYLSNYGSKKNPRFQK